GNAMKRVEGHTRTVNSLAFAMDGRFLFSVSGGRAVDGNELKLWDVSQGKDLATVPAHEAPISHLALSPDGKSLATASYDKSVKVWDVAAILLAAGQSTPAADDADSDYRPEPPALPGAECGMGNAECGMANIAPHGIPHSALRTLSPCLPLSLSPCLLAAATAGSHADDEQAAKELRIGM